MVTELGIDTSKVDSIILIEGSNYYSRSTAVLKIARDLSGLYPLLYGLIIIPNFIRNWVYDFIARNRYSWFGKRDQCMMPTAALKKRFL
jgi:predicted DCC family thiol-disulfide oxidoreductase YuxK